MTAGRPPKPTALKALEGNPGKRRLPENEPKPELVMGEVEPPEWLGAEAAAMWRDLQPRLAKLRVFSEVDYFALAMLCEAGADFMRLSRRTQRGMVQRTKAGRFAAPEMGLKQAAHARALQLLGHFGMTPSTRTKIVAGDPPKEESALAKLFAEKREAS